MRPKVFHILTGLSAGALLSLPVAAAPGDPLAALDATLARLQADTPIKGVIEVTSHATEDGDDPKKASTGHLELDVAAGDGLTLHMAPELQRQIDAEEQRTAADPEQKQPTVDLLRSMGPTKIMHMLSAAAALRVALDGASEPSAQATTLDGKPVTELSVHLPARLPKKDSGSAKDYRENAVIWLDAQGVPLRFQETAHAKFCKFFLCITVDRRHDVTLQVVSGRLVAVSDSEELKQSGLGQGTDTQITATLKLQ